MSVDEHTAKRQDQHQDMAHRGRKKNEVPTIQTAIRLDPWLVSVIDHEAAEIQRNTGVTVSRSAIMRAWLEAAAAEAEARHSEVSYGRMSMPAAAAPEPESSINYYEWWKQLKDGGETIRAAGLYKRYRKEILAGKKKLGIE